VGVAVLAGPVSKVPSKSGEVGEHRGLEPHRFIEIHPCPAAVGATFIGRSRHEALGEWETPSFVEVLVEGRSFGWSTVDMTNPGSRWRYDLVPEDGGTRLRYSMSIGPGPSGISIAIEAMPHKEPRILLRRLTEHHANMLRTVEGVRDLAEATRR